MRALSPSLAVALLAALMVVAVDPTLQAGAESVRERHAPRPLVETPHPDWALNAAIYQINTRQFTPEGSLEAARAELPRIAAMGIDIVWLMPVHPIGELQRKGSLGSPYSVRDYYGVNPELGTLDDLRAFVADAHALDMRVILDWVANHTAWDNLLVEAHPDWYARDWTGAMIPPSGTDWTDVTQLDFSNAQLRRYMADVMAWWVADVGIDGFRADVAGFVPLDFWEELRAELNEIKPVFMLAEWEQRDLHRRAFSASYAWSWNNTLHDVAMGRADAGALRGYYFYDQHNTWPADAMRLTYVSNHDQNAWVSTQFERFGPALEAAIALSVVGEGVPMVYNGQEAGNERRLAFFERDPIVWREHPLEDVFTGLFALLETNQALWHGLAGGRMTDVVTSDREAVLAFVRAKGSDAVFAVFNFSAEPREVTLEEGPFQGAWHVFGAADTVTLAPGDRVDLPAWGWRVYVRGAGAR